MFLQPFNIGIWILVLITICVLSLTLVGFYKIHPSFKKVETGNDGFTFGTSMFMTFGFICQQGMYILH